MEKPSKRIWLTETRFGGTMTASKKKVYLSVPPIAIALLLIGISFFKNPTTASDLNPPEKAKQQEKISQSFSYGPPETGRTDIRVSRSLLPDARLMGDLNETNLFLPQISKPAEEQILRIPEVVEAQEVVLEPEIEAIDESLLNEFIAEVSDGQNGVVRGIYVDGVLALPVFQQPKGDVAFVSDEEGKATEFQSAAKNGVIGILAHNHLSGVLFYDIKIGQEIVIVYGDGAIKRFVVEDIYQYQRLQRNNLRSDFIELESGERMNSSIVFRRHYRGDERVTLQTCLERDGILNWGLIFVEALPLGGN
jgi:hypothetical protein